MNIFEYYLKEEIATGILITAVVIARFLMAKIIRRYAKTHTNIEHRTNLVIKYVYILINILATIFLIIIWGVQKSDLLVTISSVATIIGVALFAQWSILSNITSGIILFFFFPFKIGDIIKIHDKDFPIQAEIEDINAFHILLKTSDGELITFPNNILLQKGISIIKNHFEDKEFLD
ncbi:mechanosensitive ion channel domain-containing protein [Flavobacterium sp.]